MIKVGEKLKKTAMCWQTVSWKFSLSDYETPSCSLFSGMCNDALMHREGLKGKALNFFMKNSEATVFFSF